MKSIVFITGGTSGIGRACAEKFAAEGYRIIITGRRKDRLENIKKELAEKFHTDILTLHFDVQNKKEVFDTISALPEDWRQISVLINNAGLSLGRDNFVDASLDDMEIMLHTNVDGLLYISKALMPILLANKTHIINIGSIAGKEVYENGNIYCVSKFAVDAITKSMRIDLLQHGLKVTAIHPGAVETEFSLVRYKGDRSKADMVYQGFTPLSGADVANVIYYAASLPPHVCLNDIVVMPTQQASTSHFNKINQ